MSERASGRESGKESVSERESGTESVSERKSGREREDMVKAPLIHMCKGYHTLRKRVFIQMCRILRDSSRFVQCEEVLWCGRVGEEGGVGVRRV